MAFACFSLVIALLPCKSKSPYRWRGLGFLHWRSQYAHPPWRLSPPILYEPNPKLRGGRRAVDRALPAEEILQDDDRKE